MHDSGPAELAYSYLIEYASGTLLSFQTSVSNSSGLSRLLHSESEVPGNPAESDRSLRDQHLLPVPEW